MHGLPQQVRLRSKSPGLERLDFQQADFSIAANRTGACHANLRHP
jgi:hypothetical protein